MIKRIIRVIIVKGWSVSAGYFYLLLMTSLTRDFAAPFKPENKKSCQSCSAGRPGLGCLIYCSPAVTRSHNVHHLLPDVETAVPAQGRALPDLSPGGGGGGVCLTGPAHHTLTDNFYYKFC